jgi:hypothetical protein
MIAALLYLCNPKVETLAGSGSKQGGNVEGLR